LFVKINFALPSGQNTVWRRCAGTSGIGQRTIPGVTRGSLELASEILLHINVCFFTNRHHFTEYYGG